MGCSSSKLDDEEAVQLCKDRKNLIKQAVEHRIRFASGHIAYIQSLKRVSAALRDYVEGDEPRQFLLDSYIIPPFSPIKKTNSGFISISPNSFSKTQIKSEPNSSFKINYLRPSGNPATLVEERPHSPEIGRVETYPPIHQFGFDGFFQMQSSPMNPSFFSYSPNNRPNLPPSSPQTSQWDFFWNPFSSLDNYGYPNRSSLDRTVMDDDIRGLRQVREEEGIPDLEEETEQEEIDNGIGRTEERGKIDLNCDREEVLVEDVDDDDDDCDCCEDELDSESETEHERKGLRSHCCDSEVSEAKNAGQVEVSNQETAVGERETREETPGFTVYVNRRPTNMAEVIKDLEDHFTTICNAASEVSAMLEASRAQYSSTSNELTGLETLTHRFL